MPTYEYACTSCSHEWEFEQSIKDEPLRDCPSCGRDTARRQISRGTGFILKGGGWYSDLYSSSSNKPAKGDGGDKPADPKPSGETSGSNSSGETKAETKKSDSTVAAA